LKRIGEAGFTGLALLDDENGLARLVFWQAFRDVELWARSPDRNALFDTAQLEKRADEISELDAEAYAVAKPQLYALLDLIRFPAESDPDTVSDACSSLTNWFEARGRLRCAVEFAIAAYLATPQQARLAARVGRVLRLLAEYPRSTNWFDFSLYLARKASDWQAYTEALAGLGNLYFQVGNFPRARIYHRRCLRAASRNRIREMAGAAYHNLFVLEMEAGNVAVAEGFAAKAFFTYGPKSACLVRLARDLSHRWTILGYFARALPLMLESVNHFTRPVDHAQVWAGVGRAAGGAGDFAAFEDAWAETWSLVRQGLTEPFTADVLLDLAHGAASLRETRRAEHAARRALEVARQRKEGHSILAAEALLDSLHVPTRDAESPISSPEELPELARGILRALQELRAAA
jgi:tetratricopeptide (TPR) repeat protein